MPTHLLCPGCNFESLGASASSHPHPAPCSAQAFRPKTPPVSTSAPLSLPPQPMLLLPPKLPPLTGRCKSLKTFSDKVSFLRKYSHRRFHFNIKISACQGQKSTEDSQGC